MSARRGLLVGAAIAVALTLPIAMLPADQPDADVSWDDATTEVEWRVCVATSDPTDANMRACDAKYGDKWQMPASRPLTQPEADAMAEGEQPTRDWEACRVYDITLIENIVVCPDGYYESIPFHEVG